MVNSQQSAVNSQRSTVSSQPWGHHYGKAVYLFRMEHPDGSFVELTNYGAAIVSVVVPDRQGELGNVVLGFPTLEGYIDDQCYLGATIGRYANRIGGARFSLEGNTWLLEQNDPPHTNHGGTRGFSSRVFDFSVSDDAVTFTLLSKNGEGGYPGNLRLQVEYTWDAGHELCIRYTATTDRTTIANFTNHAYFNLASGPGDIFGHELTIRAHEMLEMKRDYVPTGRIVPADGASFSRTKIKDRVTVSDGRISGLNNYYILDQETTDSAACTLLEPESGRVLEVFTSYPGVLLYTGDYLNSRSSGIRHPGIRHPGIRHPDFRETGYRPFDGLCLECQYYPDSPNHAHFPSTVIRAGDVYDEYIRFRFGVHGPAVRVPAT